MEQLNAALKSQRKQNKLFDFLKIYLSFEMLSNQLQLVPCAAWFPV